MRSASRMVPPRLEVLTWGECLHPTSEPNTETFAEGGWFSRCVFHFRLFSRLQLLLGLDLSQVPLAVDNTELIRRNE